MRDPFITCGSVRDESPNPYRCDQLVGHEGPHSASIPIGATPTLRITAWKVEESDALETALSLLAVAVERTTAALDGVPAAQAATHLAPTVPRALEMLASRLRDVLGDRAD
jgi:hypothetical protein